MKALLITNKPFLPTIDGGTSATKSFIKQLLNDGFEIKHLTFSSEKHPFEAQLYQNDEWKKIHTSQVEIELKIKPIQAFLALIRRESYQLSRFESKKMIETIKQFRSKDNFDIVLFDSLYSAQSIEKIKNLIPDAKYAIRTHNVESKLTKEKLKSQKNPFYKLYLSILASQLEKREKDILTQCDLILSISEEDSSTFQSWGIKHVKTLPFFPEYSNFRWKDNPNSYMYFGAMNWQPNIEAYENLKEKIFPEIVDSFANSKLYVAGSFMENIKSPSDLSIKHLGFVDDKFDFLANHGILLAPIKSSSGVRIKIIEALSIGVPVITTIAGAKGIPVENNLGMIVCENDEQFIKKAIELAENKEKRELLSKQALDFYSKWYSEMSLKTIFTNNDGKQ